MAKGNGLDEVFANMDKFERRQIKAAEVGGQLTAVQVAAFAKQNRNWTDRTNLARLGLTGTSDHTKTRTRVALAHTPFYGVFLELSNAGRYAIIQRTMRAHRHKFLENVKRLGRV